MTLSAGAAPELCAIWTWESTDAKELWCYARSSGAAVELPSPDPADEVALHPSGSRLFWTTSRQGESDETQARVGDYAAGRVSAVRSWRLDCASFLLGAIWVDASQLALQCTTGDSDDPGGLALQQVGPSPAVDLPSAHGSGGYDLYVRPGGVVEGSVLAIERQDCYGPCPAQSPPARAVRVELRTGRVVEVVATPAQGRYVESVTGGQRGIVYVTDAPGQRRDRRVYLRWPGEKHGKPVIGLPADVEEIVAQP